MRALKITLHRLSIALLSLMVMSIGGAQAAPKLKKPSPTPQPSAIVGEIEEMDDGDAALGPDEVRTTPSKDKGKVKNQKSVRALEKEKLENIKRAQEREKEKRKQEKILLGFEKAEKFHNDWFHLSPPQIKKAAENLSKFCVVACTKKHCMNLDIANNCHLMCPESTRRNCPDPLKRDGCGAEDEVVVGNEEKGDNDPLLRSEAKSSKELTGADREG